MNELINKLKDNKKSVGKIVSCFVATLLVTVLAVGLMDVTFLKDVLRFMQIQRASQEKIYNPDDIEYINCIREEGSNICIQQDSQMLLHNISGQIVDITFELKTPLEKEVMFEVSFAGQDLEFKQDNIRNMVMNKGEDTFYLKLRADISQIRLRMLTTESINLDIKQVSLNKKFTVSDVVHSYFEKYAKHLKSGNAFDRIQLIFIPLFFIGLHFCVNIKKMYQFLFKKRWIVAGIILLFLVLNKYNGDSLAMYDTIQPGSGSDYVQPVLGVPRPIRSDEWIVGAGSRLSSLYSPLTDKYNNVMRGVDTLKAPTGGVYLSYATIGKNPFSFSWAVLGKEYAYSFCWYAPIILAFMVTIELFLILTRQKKLVSVAGAFLLICSSYFMWWAFPPYILSANASIVCAYHFIYTKQKRKKILLAVGTAISLANFVLTLYPAWQVPVGYMCLAILIAMIHDNWEQIKKLSKTDYVLMIGAVLFCGTLVISYLHNMTEYTNSIMNTVYPGKRLSTGGGGIDKLFYYFQAPLYAYRDFGNPSEAGVFMSLFPIPTVLAIYIWIKEKKKDWLLGGLLIVDIVLLLYALIPFPSFIANISMLKYVPNMRLLDIIGFIQIYLLVLALAKFEEIKKIPSFIGIILSLLTAVLSCYISRKHFPGYCNLIYSLIMIVIITVIGYWLLCKNSAKVKNYISICLILISLITAIGIRPIAKGLDAIYSKPLAKEIQEIVQTDKSAKWISYSWSMSSFLLACGAPTINSVNHYPNMELWEKLDETGVYNEVYNRYEHIAVEFINEDTNMELLQEDAIRLNLSYKDFYKAEVKYIVSMVPLDDKVNDYVSFVLLYCENGSYIYEVKYQ